MKKLILIAVATLAIVVGFTSAAQASTSTCYSEGGNKFIALNVPCSTAMKVLGKASDHMIRHGKASFSVANAGRRWYCQVTVHVTKADVACAYDGSHGAGARIRL